MYKEYEHRGLDVAIFEGYWTRADVAAAPNKLFIIGDNLQREGKGGQAVIRGMENVMGIATKKAPLAWEGAYMRDTEYEANIAAIEADVVAVISRARKEGKQVVLAAGGYGTGLAYLNVYAPRTFAYLNSVMETAFGFDNNEALSLFK